MPDAATASRKQRFASAAGRKVLSSGGASAGGMSFIVPLCVSLIIVVGMVAILYAFGPSGERVTQPLAFNHAIHLEDAGLACLDCHTNAGTAVYAGLPGADICLDCHDTDDEEVQQHKEKAKLVPYAESEENIPWVRVAVTKPDVFFSHRRHVTAGEIDCLKCHPDQPALTAPPKTVGEVMTMDDCLDCHEEREVSVDCLVCHR